MWLTDEVEHTRSVDVADGMAVASWPLIDRSAQVPLQDDAGSCGVYMMILADYLSVGRTPDYGPKDV